MWLSLNVFANKDSTHPYSNFRKLVNASSRTTVLPLQRIILTTTAPACFWKWSVKIACETTWYTPLKNPPKVQVTIERANTREAPETQYIDLEWRGFSQSRIKLNEVSRQKVLYVKPVH